MTITDTDQLFSAVAAAGAAAARSLAPDGPFVAGDPVPGPLPSQPGARTVAATLTGSVAGALGLVVSAELAAAVEQGSPSGLVEALEPVLAEAAAALAATLGGAVRLGAAGETASQLADDGGLALSVPLGDGPPASLVLVVDEVGAPGEEPRPGAHEFEALAVGKPGGAASRSLELLQDVEMAVTAELGRTRMTVRDLLSLTPGGVVELDRSAGGPVDVLVNNTLIARGEVVVIDEEFGVRITEIIGLNAHQNRAGT